MTRVSAATQFASLVASRTSPYVWAILLALVVLGSLQLREQVVRRGRVLLLTSSLCGLSLFGMISAFGPQWIALLAWSFGLIAFFKLGSWLQWPRVIVRPVSRNAFAVAGSVIPMVAILAMFGVFYALNVALALHPDWTRITLLSVAAGVVYGVLPGLLAARARRILASTTHRPMPDSISRSKRQ